MTLIVNKDTYITLEEANTYLSQHYVSTDPLLIQWNSLSDNDKEVFLRRAFDQMNSLPYTGRPKNPKQLLPFPRHNFDSNDYLKIKYAQAEQSISYTDMINSNEVADRIRLRRAGVIQYSIGDLSERFQSGLPVESNANFFGMCEKSYKYLSKWLQGGYEICTSTRHRCGPRFL